MAKFLKRTLPSVSALITSIIIFMMLDLKLLIQLIFYPTSPRDPHIVLVLFRCIAVPTGHIVLFGVPAVMLLRKIKMFRWWSMLISGLLIGCVSASIFAWPNDANRSGYEDNNGVQVIKEISTNSIWIEYIKDVALMGIIGAITAIVFWFVWTRINSTIDEDAKERLSSQH